MAGVKEIRLKIPFSTLTSLLEGLDLEDLLRLWGWLDEKLAEWEDEVMLTNPRIAAEIRKAREEYEAGDYIRLEDLIAELDEPKNNI